MTGCDFLWAVCGVVGAVCRAVCGHYGVCACSNVCIERCCRGCAGRCAGVRDLCVCVLWVSVWCM